MSMPDKAWNRLGYPPTPWLCIGAIALVAADAVLMGILWELGWQVDPLDRRWMVPLLALPMMGTVVAAAVLGMYRVSRFPSPTTPYAGWLRRTPWNGTQRTPFGPWRPVAPDILPLGLLSGFCLLHAVGQTSVAFQSASGIEAWVCWSAAIAGPWLAFGLAWAARGYAIVRGRWTWDWWVIAVCLGAAANAKSHDALELLVALVPACALLLFVTVWRRLQLVLHELPESTVGKSSVTGISEKITGGIYNTLRPSLDRPLDKRLTNVGDCLPVEPRLACAIGSALFVWFMTFASPLAPAYQYSVSVFISGLMILPAMLYAIVWTTGAGSHLSPSARWATRKLVVWEYDRVWLAPMLVMPLATGAALWVGWFLLPSVFCVPLAVSIGLTVGIMVGPNRERWWLTAPLRYSRESSTRRRPTGA